jgi:hypothetical protein
MIEIGAFWVMSSVRARGVLFKILVACLCTTGMVCLGL